MRRAFVTALLIVVLLAGVVLATAQPGQPTPKAVLATSTPRLPTLPTLPKAQEALTPATPPTVEASPTPQLLRVQAQALHVRACPDVLCQVVAYLSAGQQVGPVQACTSGWAELPQGWVKAEYLKPVPCLEPTSY